MIETALPSGRETPPGTTLFHESIEAMLIAVDLSLDQRALADARAWLETYDQWITWSGATLGVADGQLRGWPSVPKARPSRRSPWRVRPLHLRRIPSSRSCSSRPIDCRVTSRPSRRRSADARVLLETSLELATTCQIPYEQTLAHASLASVLIDMDELEAAGMHYERPMPMVELLGLAPLRPQLAKIATRLPSSPGISTNGLTPRELDVLKLAALGMTDAAIGEALFISPRTASQHLRSIYGKLGVSTRAAATRYAIEHSLA